MPFNLLFQFRRLRPLRLIFPKIVLGRSCSNSISREGRRRAFYVLFEFPAQRFGGFVSVIQYNENFDNHPPDPIRRSHNCCFPDPGKGAFNLKRSDTIPGALNYVVVPPEKPEVSVSIPQDFISGVIPVIYKCFPVLFGIVDIFTKEPGGRGLQEMASLLPRHYERTGHHHHGPGCSSPGKVFP